MSNLKYQLPNSLRSLSIVLPAYNEAENIVAAVESAVTAAARITSDYEVIVVNDGSKDGTAVTVKSLQRKYPNALRLLDNPRNLGYGPTVRRGLSSARKEWVFFTDADNQFDLNDLSKLVPYTDGFDFVVGRRRNRKDSFRQRRNAKIFNIAVRLCFGIRIKDVDCAFKLMRRSKLHSFELVSESAMINTEILHRARKAKLKIKEIDVTHLPRVHGQSTGANPDVIKKALKEFFVLRWQLLGDSSTLMKINSRFVGISSLTCGVAVTVWAYKNGTILAYGDAEAHLNIAKRVISSLTPGYAQLGGIWLPLPHLLMVPFVINNWLWRSGVGGSIPTVLAFVWLCVISYKLAYELTGNFKASYIAPLVFILNPNSLYMAATPMTEILLLSMFTTSVYYFIKWLRTNLLLDLVLASFFTALATLSRYDGWALVCTEAVLLIAYLVIRGMRYKAIEGMTLLYSFVAFSGVFLWLVWNKLIFGSFLYFANSVYGSKVQQEYFLKSGYLPTYHDLLKSILYFLEDTRLVVGLPIALLTLLGMIVITVKAFRTHRIKYLALVFLALTPFAFYVASLYLGQASLILPTFAKSGALYTISNVRYGVQMLLAVSIFLAFLGSRFKKLAPFIVVALALQSFYFVYTGTVTTYIDGTTGLSAQSVSKGPDAPAVEQYMRNHYDSGLVLMDDYRRPIGIVESGIPMDRFIGSGNKPYWNESFDDPGKFAKWVIVQKSSTDAVWTGVKRKDLLDAEFVPVFNKGDLYIYEKRVASNDLVVRSGQHLTLANKPYAINGVNSYDMLSQNDSTIQNRMQAFAALRYNAVRVWCFNQQGTLTDQNFHSLDTLMQVAQNYNVRVVCVLGNTLNDYGGPLNFKAANSQAFFTGSGSISAYEAFIGSVLNHTSEYTGVKISQSPYILAWELINEPRVEGAASSSILMNWTNTIGEYILSIDRSHLVSPGTEGFTTSYSEQYYNQQHGASIEDLCSLEVISLCSGHLYPKYISPSGSESAIDVAGMNTTIETWRAIADKLNKPFYIGEVGFDLSEDNTSYANRETFFQNVNRAVNQNKLDGALIWNVGANADAHFTLQYNDPQSRTILNNWNVTP